MTRARSRRECSSRPGFVPRSTFCASRLSCGLRPSTRASTHSRICSNTNRNWARTSILGPVSSRTRTLSKSTADDGGDGFSETPRDWRAVQLNMIGEEQAKRKELLTRKRRFLPFEDVREWARALSFKSESDWDEMVSDGRKNSYIPSDPPSVYADEWVSWDDFLGVVDMLEFDQARDYARNLKLVSAAQWYEHIREGKLPENVPERPMQVYRSQWVDFDDWLGVERLSEEV
eukprot:CAMPEP_0114229642 /NCGR_PEP_ID=MMETSP0058-20121206/3026_1 /TAXON_ID=36894 /ORGANISM="Pyramimonas parkeae, CCMP726" /LENGTH=231 /DNA_ID=CAMNT_0001340751 /DNA_START=100 /DNA_END=795 /DNA_ORIENTATION=-